MGEKGKEELNTELNKKTELASEASREVQKKKIQIANLSFSSFSPNAGPGPRLGM